MVVVGVRVGKEGVRSVRVLLWLRGRSKLSPTRAKTGQGGQGGGVGGPCMGRGGREALGGGWGGVPCLPARQAEEGVKRENRGWPDLVEAWCWGQGRGQSEEGLEAQTLSKRVRTRPTRGRTHQALHRRAKLTTTPTTPSPHIGPLESNPSCCRRPGEETRGEARWQFPHTHAPRGLF